MGADEEDSEGCGAEGYGALDFSDEPIKRVYQRVKGRIGWFESPLPLISSSSDLGHVSV